MIDRMQDDPETRNGTPQRGPQGRKSRLTPEVQRLIVNRVRAGNYKEVAARSVGIAERTFWGWMKAGEEQETVESGKVIGLNRAPKRYRAFRRKPS